MDKETESDFEEFEDALEDLEAVAKIQNVTSSDCQENSALQPEIRERIDQKEFQAEPSSQTPCNIDDQERVDSTSEDVACSTAGTQPNSENEVILDEDQRTGTGEFDSFNGSSCTPGVINPDDAENTDSSGDEEEAQEDNDARKQREDAMEEGERECLKEKAQELKKKGNEQFRDKSYEEALVQYTDALHICPLCYTKERAILYSNRAACKMHLERYEGAIEDSSKAVDLNPQYLKALLRRAELHEKTDKLDEALADYQRVLEMDPSQHSARQACMRLPDKIKERNEKLKEEMMGKLKDLGNMVLKPFGLSTDNFKLTQDPNTGSYSVNFQQNK